MDIASLEYILMFILIKTTSKKIKMAINLYHSILQCIFLVKNLKNIYSRSSFMCSDKYKFTITYKVQILSFDVNNL